MRGAELEGVNIFWGSKYMRFKTFGKLEFLEDSKLGGGSKIWRGTIYPDFLWAILLDLGKVTSDQISRI